MSDAERRQSEIASARHADRYGKIQRAGRPWIPWALSIAVVLAGVGVAFLGYQKYGPKDIEAEGLGYQQVDESTMTVRFKVTRKDPQQPVVCFVRVMSSKSEEIGRREVLIPGQDSGTVELTTTVKSSSRPSAGNVYGCTDQVPSYLK
ncbi:DUF4307 domain-containing protein [Nocardia sp. XZ_19_385]|uniref:DUF4307 domain-containing protein n=1 Tax=Nocardia sp. XZ_19_385 TaxID=2769488 RepID=UPI00188FB967|nr:DUF4307 domain-containing protein [Nocardia sp. XZ_19_385]